MSGTGPGVVVVHDWYGLLPHVAGVPLANPAAADVALARMVGFLHARPGVLDP